MLACSPCAGKLGGGIAKKLKAIPIPARVSRNIAPEGFANWDRERARTNRKAAGRRG